MTMDKNSNTFDQAYEQQQALQLIAKGFVLIRFFAGREEHYPFIWEIANALHQMPTIIAQQPDRLADEIEHIEQLFSKELNVLEQTDDLANGVHHQ